MKTKNPWFGPKRWGWGWRPVSWQGWVVILIYIIVVILIAKVANTIGLTKFYLAVIIATIVLALIAYFTGSKPGSSMLK